MAFLSNLKANLSLPCILLAGLVLFAAGITACSSNDASADEEVLAVVGDFEISKTHYLNELQRVNARAGYALNLSPDMMESVLNSRLNRYVVVEYARESGWDQEPDAVYEKALIERKSIMEEFERRFITDYVQVSEQDLRELFYRVNTSVRASHLFARNRHEADSLHALLQQGGSWDELASSIFRNPDLARNGGDLGFFTVDDMDISFEDMAYRMEIGDVSAPVQTSRGFSIIKVTDIVTTPVITETQFAEKREELGMIAREQQTELAVRRHLRETIDSFDFDNDLIEQLWEDIQNDPDGYLEHNPELNRLQVNLSPQVAGGTVAQLGNFVFTTDDFLREAFYTPFSQRLNTSSYHDFRRQVEGMAYRAHALSAAREHPNYNSHYVQRTIEETFYNYLNERFNDYVEQQVVVDEEDIRREFEKNAEFYAEPLQLDMAEIVVTSQQAADHVWNELQGGADFNETLRRYTADPAARETNGRLGFIPIDRFGMMAPALGQVQPGEYAGPFQITGARFHIFKCMGRIEPRPLSYEEAIPKVREVLATEAADDLKMRIIGDARDRFNATVFTDRLQSIPKQL
ncbi:MAG: peptidylprolyl isomerase [Balneolia bacterium]|nr:peptidylprolyl isomerase [Balneolia bacterium]